MPWDDGTVSDALGLVRPDKRQAPTPPQADAAITATPGDGEVKEAAVDDADAVHAEDVLASMLRQLFLDPSRLAQRVVDGDAAPPAAAATSAPTAMSEVQAVVLQQFSEDDAWVSGYLSAMAVPVTLTVRSQPAAAPASMDEDDDADSSAAPSRAKRRRLHTSSSDAAAAGGASAASPSTSAAPPQFTAAVTIVPPPVKRQPPNYLLRPRLSRGGRLVLDRIRITGTCPLRLAPRPPRRRRASLRTPFLPAPSSRRPAAHVCRINRSRAARPRHRCAAAAT